MNTSPNAHAFIPTTRQILNVALYRLGCRLGLDRVRKDLAVSFEAGLDVSSLTAVTVERRRDGLNLMIDLPFVWADLSVDLVRRQPMRVPSFTVLRVIDGGRI